MFPERQRFLWCACLALGLHAVLSLLGFGSSRAAQTLPVHDAAVDAGVISVEEEPVGSGAPPGGGSVEPDPAGRASTPEQTVAPPRPAPKVVRSAVPKVTPAVTETLEGEAPLPAASDLLAADEGEAAMPARPKAARRVLLEPQERASAAAPDAAEQARADSNAEGSGLGANGGPGGLGQGNGGVIGKRFAFGGPTGAFRADVCFIEPGTRVLKDVKSCPRVTSFYTDVLNVAPRTFTEGFPGVGDRVEWFAIRYRGKFKVESADYYTFRLLSDDGSILTIDGYPIIDNDGEHAPRSKEMTITLEAGDHDFDLFYYQGHRDFIALQLFVTPFNKPERLFGPRL